MNVVERARLRDGDRVEWQGRCFIYCGYSNKVHTLKEENVSGMIEYLPLCYRYPSELTSKWPVPEPTIEAIPMYIHLAKDEILNAKRK